MKKILSVLFCVIIIFSAFVSCNTSSDENETTAQVSLSESVASQTETTIKSEITKDITLGYIGNKSLNPYKTDSATNNYLACLIYDPLFRNNESYNPKQVIASGYAIDGKNVSVKVGDGMTFSDGAQISVYDVVYSFNCAKKSNFYKNRLSNFSSCSIDGNSIIFTLSHADIYCISCLDFPIIKSSTGDNSSPIGSGRYKLEKKNSGYVLIENSSSTSGENLTTKTIKLFDMNSTENELYRLRIGELSSAFDDLSSGKYEKISANTANVPLNNLVYLGFNSSNEVLSKNIRQAIICALDRKLISDVAYDRLSTVCTTPFNSFWSEVSNFSDADISKDTVSANSILDSCKFVYEVDGNKIRSRNFELLSLKFIVNSENPQKVECAKLIEEQLEAVGIDIDLEESEYDDYLSALKDGDFDLYLGETKLSPNMDLSSFFDENGQTSYGIDTNSSVSSAYFDLIGGKIDMTTFVQVFNEEKPFLPICYRIGLIYYSRELSYEGAVSEGDIFGNVSSWEIK